MRNRKEREDAFRRSSLPDRLRKIAAEIRGISELARVSANAGVVQDLLDETRGLIDWTAPEIEMDPLAGSELANLQVTLTLWLDIWRDSSKRRDLQVLLHHEMRCWSFRIEDFAERIAAVLSAAAT